MLGCLSRGAGAAEHGSALPGMRAAATGPDPPHRAATRREQENGRTRRPLFIVGAGHPRHIGGRRGFGKKPGRAEPCSAAFREGQEQPSMARLYLGRAPPRRDPIRRIAPRPDPPRTREWPHEAAGLHCWRRSSTALRGRRGYGTTPGRAEPCSAAFRAGQEQPSMARLYLGCAPPRPDPIRRIAPRPDPPRTREWPHEAAALHCWRRSSTALRAGGDTAQRQVEPSHARLLLLRAKGSRAWLGSTWDARRPVQSRRAAPRPVPSRPVPPRPSARRTAERPHKAAVLHCTTERISLWRRSPRPGPRTPGCPG